MRKKNNLQAGTPAPGSKRPKLQTATDAECGGSERKVRSWKVPHPDFQNGGFWLEGRNIRVWWDGEARWYEGIVDTYDDDAGHTDSHGNPGPIHVVLYDDGIYEENLAVARWELDKDEGDDGTGPYAEDGEDDQAGAGGGDGQGQSKQKRAKTGSGKGQRRKDESTARRSRKRASKQPSAGKVDKHGRKLKVLEQCMAAFVRSGLAVGKVMESVRATMKTQQALAALEDCQVSREIRDVDQQRAVAAAELADGERTKGEAKRQACQEQINTIRTEVVEQLQLDAEKDDAELLQDLEKLVAGGVEATEGLALLDRIPKKMQETAEHRKYLDKLESDAKLGTVATTLSSTLKEWTQEKEAAEEQIQVATARRDAERKKAESLSEEVLTLDLRLSTLKDEVDKVGWPAAGVREWVQESETVLRVDAEEVLMQLETDLRAALNQQLNTLLDKQRTLTEEAEATQKELEELKSKNSDLRGHVAKGVATLKELLVSWSVIMEDRGDAEKSDIPDREKGEDGEDGMTRKGSDEKPEHKDPEQKDTTMREAGGSANGEAAPDSGRKETEDKAKSDLETKEAQAVQSQAGDGGAEGTGSTSGRAGTERAEDESGEVEKMNVEAWMWGAKAAEVKRVLEAAHELKGNGKHAAKAQIMMREVGQPIRALDEHKKLLEKVQRMRRLGDKAGTFAKQLEQAHVQVQTVGSSLEDTNLGLAELARVLEASAAHRAEVTASIAVVEAQLEQDAAGDSDLSVAEGGGGKVVPEGETEPSGGGTNGQVKHSASDGNADVQDADFGGGDEEMEGMTPQKDTVDQVEEKQKAALAEQEGWSDAGAADIPSLPE